MCFQSLGGEKLALEIWRPPLCISVLHARTLPCAVHATPSVSLGVSATSLALAESPRVTPPASVRLRHAQHLLPHRTSSGCPCLGLSPAYSDGHLDPVSASSGGHLDPVPASSGGHLDPVSASFDGRLDPISALSGGHLDPVSASFDGHLDPLSALSGGRLDPVCASFAGYLDPVSASYSFDCRCFCPVASHSYKALSTSAQSASADSAKFQHIRPTPTFSDATYRLLPTDVLISCLVCCLLLVVDFCWLHIYA